MTEPKPCTCHPNERPIPCQHKYALSECLKAKPRSVYDQFKKPGGGYDYQAMEEAGFDAS